VIQSAQAFDVFQTFSGGAPLPTTLGALVTRLLPNIIVVAALFFFFLIIFYGFKLIQHAGGVNVGPQQLTNARSAIMWSIIGFLLVVTAFFILQIMGGVFGINFTNPGLF